MPLHPHRKIPFEQKLTTEVPLPIKFPQLPLTSSTGFAKGHSGTVCPFGSHDRFGRIDTNGHVLTPVNTTDFMIGTVLVQDDRKARERNGIANTTPIPPTLRFFNCYPDIFKACRGISRGPVKYDAVEHPVITDVEGAVSQLYTRHIIINPHDPAEAEAWREYVMTAANALGMDVVDEQKHAALLALIAMSDVNDASGRVNIERMSLVCLMIERLLRERFGSMAIKRCRMNTNLLHLTGELKKLISLVTTMDRLAFQAFNSDPLTGDPGNVIRQDNAAHFWREHSMDVRHHAIRPFGNWFYAMSIVLNRAAEAMDEGEIGVVRKNMQILQAIAAVAKGRIAVERVLAPVAEMRDLARRKGDEEGAFRTFSESWAAQECTTVLNEWNTVHSIRTAPIVKSESNTAVTKKLTDAQEALTNNNLEQGYAELKKVAELLERRIVLPAL